VAARAIEQRWTKVNDDTNPVQHRDTAENFLDASDPFLLFADWLDEAVLHEPIDANAMSLATVDARGMPNVRMVLLKGLDDETVPARGFVFYTNLGSAKAHELTAQPWAALLFHWKSLHRQIRIRGPVTPVEAAEADAYFATRPRGSQIGAWASDQSRPLRTRQSLQERVAEAETRFAGLEVLRPPYWSGFRLTPLEIEFWHNRPYRLHDRLVFRRPTPAEHWRKSCLFP
jgi:pyridoxamine 5'-phosphate oxidase